MTRPNASSPPPCPHIVIDVAPHGFGHLAQASVVIAGLRQALPDARLTLRCGLSAEVIGRFITQPIETAKPGPEIGLPMLDPNRVDMAATRAFYRDLHADWDGLVACEAARLVALAPDLVLANISEVTLAAAAQAGIPAIGFCSLNWHDILAAHVGDDGEFRPILTRMRAAYASAQRLIRLMPALPMADFPNTVAVGPVARIGRADGMGLRARLGLASSERLALVSFGGIGGGLVLPGLPPVADLTWLVDDPRLLDPARPNIRATADTGMPFIDLLSSVDLVLAKPGYGTFTDAVCNGVRLLQFGRPTWPETPYLTDWADCHGVQARLPDGGEGDGVVLAQAAQALLARPRAICPPQPTGGREAARIIAELL